MYQTPLFELLFIYANKYIKAKQTAGRRRATGGQMVNHIREPPLGADGQRGGEQEQRAKGRGRLRPSPLAQCACRRHAGGRGIK